jgi:glycosyltransferase involved in cell wall biosynthesis
MNKTGTLICLPTYNEVACVREMINSIKAIGFEVFVTDGGSDDGTRDIVTELGITMLDRPGQGKAAGMRQAIQYAHRKEVQILGFIDCDMTYPVNRIPDLLDLLSECDMAVGARNMLAIKQPNRMGNYFFTGLINFLYGSALKDTQSGLRLIRVNKYADLLNAKGMDLEAEITCKSLSMGMKIMELDIDYHERVGETKIRLLDGLPILFRILYERF